MIADARPRRATDEPARDLMDRDHSAGSARTKEV